MRRFEISIRGTLFEFERLVPALSDFLRESRVPSSLSYSVHLVVEELASNVIRHGSAGTGSRTIEVAVHLEADRAIIGVSDDGPPFDPTSRPSPNLEQSLADRKPGGLGIHLVRSLAESMRYERRGEWNHVEVELKTPSST